MSAEEIQKRYSSTIEAAITKAKANILCGISAGRTVPLLPLL